jgi:hypothetical protein
MAESDSLLLDVAYHEAAHAVIQYRASGSADAWTSIIPNAEEGTLGHSQDGLTDSSSESDCRARILSCYAGGYSDRKRGCYQAAQCFGDEQAANEILLMRGWESRGSQLRSKSRGMVEMYWNEIAAVAEELIRSKKLDMTEIEIIADLAAGDQDTRPEDLTMYRALKAGV